MYLGRGIGFYFDEWTFILERRGHSLDAFLKPHNEHIVLVPVIIYKLLFALVGLAHHWPYLAVLALMHVGIGVGVYLLVSRRLGGWAGVIAATLILFMGLAWQNMLWAFQIGFVGSVLGGVWAWVALDRRDGRGDALACVALLLGTASSSLGVPLALGVGAEIVVQRRWRGLWVALVPLVLYGLWYLGYGASDVTGEGVFHAVGWAGAVTAAAGALFGVGRDWGQTLVILGVLVLGWQVAVAVPSARLVGLLVGGVTFWLLTGAARSVFQPPVVPETSRYLTLGAVILLLATVELARGIAVPPTVLVYAAMITLVAVALGLPALRDNARQLRGFGTVTAAELGALQLLAARVPAAYPPDASTTPAAACRPYFEAVKAYGSSPADSPSELEAAAAPDRAQADRVLQEINVHLQPASTKGQDCRVARPAAGGGPAVVTATVPAAGLVVRALGDQPADLRLRRFGNAFANASLGSDPKAQPQLLRMPPDASPRPYVAQAQSAGPVALCAAG